MNTKTAETFDYLIGQAREAHDEAARVLAEELRLPTPESLFILLTSEGPRKLLKSVRTLIVDEIQKVRGWSEVAKRLWDEERGNQGGCARCCSVPRRCSCNAG